MPARLVDVHHGDVLIGTDPERVGPVAVHGFVSEQSSWAPGRSFEVQARAIEHGALVAGADDSDGVQVGFARMVTDLAAFAWSADVYVAPEVRGRGLGTTIVWTIVDHPDVGVPRQILATEDDHGLCERFGHRPLDDADHVTHRTPSGPT
ncbi:MAG: GNAT family N-acetyltransferase [Ilumatobacter sp.]|uniref:GNAT family N-acetyltransferase n=1 Tax=Ilumatobacter sp. TaxID=1967498 RepID=UPI002638DF5A|nr:GNAT family N-acetyltransferase [Ilumatobacter sp.]MDJ0771432.1 GNAT family N-acetyltransferase [Ilumatobacter sp.]